MFEGQVIKNDQEGFSQITNQRSQSLGIKSILSRYKSNSQILQISNWFAQNTIHYDQVISNQIRFLGNSSDLWSLLCFEIKAVGSVLTSNDMDINLTKKQCEFGQIFMLYKAQSKISNLKIKLEIEAFYLQKIIKLREQMLKERIQSLENPYSRRTWSEKNSVWLISEYFSEDNEIKITSWLQNLLKCIIAALQKSQAGQASLKTQQVISLICMSLLFVLANLQWDRVCISQFSFTQYLTKHLIQANGAMIIGKFLHDARSNVLAAQVDRLRVEVFKQ